MIGKQRSARVCLGMTRVRQLKGRLYSGHLTCREARTMTSATDVVDKDEDEDWKIGMEEKMEKGRLLRERFKPFWQVCRAKVETFIRVRVGVVLLLSINTLIRSLGRCPSTWTVCSFGDNCYRIPTVYLRSCCMLESKHIVFSQLD